MVAQRIGEWLDKKNINWDGFVVEESVHLNINKKRFEKPIYILEEYIVNNKCDIIIGFQEYSRDFLYSKNTVNIGEIYNFDFQGMLAIGSQQENMVTADYLKKNEERINNIKKSFEDKKSLEAYENFINQKLVGNYAKEYSSCPQYIDPEIIQFKENEMYVDCGAYHGEDIFMFINRLHECAIEKYRVLAFEADVSNAQKVREIFSGNVNVSVCNKGVWKESVCLPFSMEGNRGSSIGGISSEETIECICIDEACRGMDVSFISMDVEGCELEALQGAENVIKKLKPKLAISIYHKSSDFIDIPEYVLSLNSEYKLYCRNYAPSGTETILYAI